MLNIFLKSDDEKIIVVYKNKRYSVRDMKALIAGRIEEIKSKSKDVIISSDNSFAFFVNFFAAIFANKNIILLADSNNMYKFNTDAIILDDDFTKRIPDYSFPPVDIDKPIITCLTSGTSDASKCIKKSLCNLMTEAEDIVKEFNLKSKKYNFVSSTTMTHLFGMTFHLFVPLTAGSVIYADKITYPELSIKDCIFVSTPSFLNYFEKHNINFETTPEYIISAGAKLPQKTFEYLEKKSKVIEIYGSTEAGATGYKLSSKEHSFTPFSKVKVSKNNDGNIVVNTKYSYSKKVVIPDGADIQDGKIYLKERTDRTVKIYEKRINLEDQEKFLKKSEYISDACCLKHNDKLVAVVVLSEIGKKYLLANGIITFKKMLKQYCSQNSDVVPQRWRFLSEIPSTPAGKIDKNFIDYLFSVKFSFPIVLNKEFESDEVKFRLFMPQNSSFYDGHFPQNPITPGVVLLYLAHTLSKYIFKSSDISSDMRRVKFSKIMPPETIVDLALKKNDKNIEFSYSNEDTVFSTGNFPIR